MQRERIDITAERADDEGNALAHEASDEGDIAAEPVELGDCNFTFRLLGGLERGLELRAAIERVGTLAGLDLGEFGCYLEALGLGERLDSSALAL